MRNVAGIMLRLANIKVEFGDVAFEQASHAASVAVARYVLDLAVQRAEHAAKPPCPVVPLVLISRNDEE
jgi:hypothetical protein